MKLTSKLSLEQRRHVEARLHSNLMAWLTTVRPNGQPESVPVWFFLQDDETIVIYSQPGAVKLRNIALNPRVTLGLDVTDIGRDIVRIEGTAKQADGFPASRDVPGYRAKYTERIAALFGDAEGFAEAFSVAVIITPTTLRATVPGLP